MPTVPKGLAPLPATFPKAALRGTVVYRPAAGVEDDDYNLATYQYAFSSRTNGSMTPAAIVYAHDVADIQAVVAWAQSAGVAIATRSGGHSFGGFSSTTAANVVVDMTAGADFKMFRANDGTNSEWAAGTWTFGTGNRLQEVEEWFAANTQGAVFGHGGCSHVGVGGHTQTGGMGMFTRALGLFIDYIVGFRIVLADGRHVAVHKPDPIEGWEWREEGDDNGMLWYGVLGGGTGNFGIVTDVTIKPIFDKDLPESRAYSKIYVHWPNGKSKPLVKALLTRICEMNDNNEYACDFNLSVAVASKSRWGALPSIDSYVLKYHPDVYGKQGQMPHPFNVIAVQASWINTSGDPAAYDDKVRAFFASLDAAAAGHIPIYTQFDAKEALPVSELIIRFTYQGVREYDQSFMRRNYATTATNLIARGFPEWVADRTEEVLSRDDGAKVSFQTSPLGGRFSKMGLNAGRTKTCMQWRDQTMHVAFDCWYYANGLDGEGGNKEGNNTSSKNFIAGFIQRIQSEMVGSASAVYSTETRKYLWDPASSTSMPGSVDLHADYKYYFTEEQYARLCATKKRFDPKFVFNATKFGVMASLSPIVQAMQLDDMGVPASVGAERMIARANDTQQIQRSIDKKLIPDFHTHAQPAAAGEQPAAAAAAAAASQ